MSLAYYYPVTGPAYDVFVACGVPMFSRTQGGSTEYYVLDWGEALAIVDAAFGEKPVKVEFSLFQLAREDIPGIDDLSAQITACYEYKKDSPKEGPALKELRNSIYKPIITCLRISDFNTTGVEGASTNQRGTPFWQQKKREN